MKFRPFILFLTVIAVLRFAPFTFAQEMDGSDVRRDLRERNERVSKLSTEDQLKLRGAEQKAAEDPAVKAALERRDAAIREFRATLRASMIKADPSVKPILEKVAIDTRRAPTPAPKPTSSAPSY